MSVAAAALRWDLPFPAHVDRSLGDEGRALRKSLDVATAPPRDARLEVVLARLNAALIKASARDVLVSAEVVIRAFRFMNSIPSDIPLPAAVVESESEIGLDWDEDDRRVVSVTVDSTTFVGYSALLGREPHYGRLEIAAGFPDTLRFLLAKVYPKQRK